MMEDFRHMKWLPLSAGVLLCGLGAASLLRPAWMAGIVPLCVGTAILILGGCEVGVGIAAKGHMPRYIAGMHRLRGAVNIAVGLVFLLNRALSLLFVAVTLGLWAAAFGFLRLYDALHRRKAGAPWRGCAADAAVKIGVGVGMLVSPIGSMTVWMVIVGIFFLIVGVSVIVSALFLDGVLRDFGDF